MKSSTHGTLRRYEVTFPSTADAEAFHHRAEYVYAKEPVKLADIKRTRDGRTVVVYAFSRYYDRKSMQAEARKSNGRVAGYGSDSGTRARDVSRDKLTARARRALPSRVFALPERRALPLENASHVRNAAARLEQMRKRGTVTRAEYSRARRAIDRAERRFRIAAYRAL